jgi:uncharacterized membrane protein
MKPLIVLLVSFAIILVITKFTAHNFEFALSARISMAVMIIFTASGHFAFTKGMTMMVPDVIPYKKTVIYLSGIAEILLAIGLLIPAYRIISAWALIVLFILLLPANIKAAKEHIDYQKGNFEGSGLKYLWFRMPLQILFILWIYLSAIKF